MNKKTKKQKTNKQEKYSKITEKQKEINSAGFGC